MTTKADLITPEELAGLDRTRLGYPCTGCGLMLRTEGDFARHFTISDPRFLNLGECPRKQKARKGRRLHDEYEAVSAGGHLSHYVVVGLDSQGYPRSENRGHSDRCGCITDPEGWF